MYANSQTFLSKRKKGIIVVTILSNFREEKVWQVRTLTYSKQSPYISEENLINQNT